MIADSDFLTNKLGHPKDKKTFLTMSVWYVPEQFRKKIPCLPNKIYCNITMQIYLEEALELVIIRNLQKEIKSYNGCYIVRPIRGTEGTDHEEFSTHSWGIAIDINKKWNELGQEPQMNPALVACFDQWFDWGGEFRRKDGMHFQLKRELL